VGIEVVVLQEAEYAAVQVVGAALHHCQHGAAIHVAELGIGVRRDDPNLAQRVWTWIIAKRVVDVLVDLLAVQKVVIRLLPVSVYGYLGTAINVALG